MAVAMPVAVGRIGPDLMVTSLVGFAVGTMIEPVGSLMCSGTVVGRFAVGAAHQIGGRFANEAFRAEFEEIPHLPASGPVPVPVGPKKWWFHHLTRMFKVDIKSTVQGGGGGGKQSRLDSSFSKHIHPLSGETLLSKHTIWITTIWR